jgi:hypothetical protein
MLRDVDQVHRVEMEDTGTNKVGLLYCLLFHIFRISAEM